MQKNDLLQKEKEIIRVLELKDDKAFIIPCTRQSMPYWIDKSELESYSTCTEEHLLQANNMIIPAMELLSPESKRFVHEHFTLIAGILPYVSDEKKRKHIITQIAEENEVSKQTVRYYLCLYLIYMDMAAFAPKERVNHRKLEYEL